jgi:hypothetical protein
MVLGIGNTFASIPGILAPYLVGFVTKNVNIKENFMVLTNLINKI